MQRHKTNYNITKPPAVAPECDFDETHFSC